ncbi:LytR C-terminal domain-containing protein [Xylanimonas protaetiae]|uniref:LytR/CpsA/Psr regulator C-terminal domain-containing protein n=1 Tax=Xylanimonas protaetiae TaxID=2509457 RepID=A0A4P6F4L7_9MICO|nr:LytR C-terminal domain-containing protein [Xylanimonas protaetiae]QAY69159.1 hypothetical protein ET471_03130 [Xylanimonas protaetiae]
MSRSQYPYPPDEFDVRSPDDSPVGVHRAPRSTWSGLWPFLLVAVIAVAVAVGGVMFLSRDNGTADDAGGATDTNATAPAEDGTADAPADGTDAPADGASPPADTTSPPAADPAADLTTLLAAANLDAHVRVLNDSGISGEAARGKTALDGKGFTQVEAGNPPAGFTSPATTSVWFAEGKDDTAKAVAAALGIPAGNVSQQAIREGDVIVIIKSALTPAG